MKQKKTKKTHPAAGQGIPLSPAEETLLNQLQARLDHLDPAQLGECVNSPKLAMALIHGLPLEHPKTAEIILALGGLFQDKETLKEIKKVSFKLKQKGVAVSFPEKTQAPVFQIQAGQKFISEAYVSPVDAFGNQAVLISLEQPGLGVEIGIGTVNDEEGLLEFLFDRYSKKKALELKAMILAQFPKMISTSVAHSATLLEKAYQRKAGDLKEPVRGYLQLRPWILDQVTLLQEPVIFESIAPDQVQAIPLSESLLEKLFGHSLMETWVIDPDKLKPLIGEILKVRESPILLSETQREMRIQDLKEKSLLELFTEDRKALFKNRLEEMAYVFYKHKEEDYAQTALTVAASLAEKGMPGPQNAFFKKLLERTLILLLPDKNESRLPDKSSPSLILKP